MAGSYGYSSWMGIKSTPSFVINGKKKITGLPTNFSRELCSHIKLTSTVLSGGAAEGASASASQSLAQMSSGPPRWGAGSWASSWADRGADGAAARRGWGLEFGI